MNSQLASIKSNSSLNENLKELVEAMEQSAIKAARLILKKLDPSESLDSWKKSDDTVVTAADIESQVLLVQELKTYLPMVCEEDPASHRLLETENNYILIDPLDGTTSARRFGNAMGGQVGYGPIVGLVLDSRLAATVFINIPQRTGYLAIKGCGCESFSLMEDRNKRTQLAKVTEYPIDKSAMLFYAGKRGELEALSKVRKGCALENYYRFGGFANDAVRIALNQEQIQLQFSVKAWDLPAALIPFEAGCKVVLQPLGDSQELEDYRLQLENPLLLGQTKLVDEVLPLIRAV